MKTVNFSETRQTLKKLTSFRVRFFLFIYFKDKKEHRAECHSIKNMFFFYKKIESHRFS